MSSLIHFLQFKAEIDYSELPKVRWRREIFIHKTDIEQLTFFLDVSMTELTPPTPPPWIQSPVQTGSVTEGGSATQQPVSLGSALRTNTLELDAAVALSQLANGHCPLPPPVPPTAATLPLAGHHPPTWIWSPQSDTGGCYEFS